MRARRDRHDLMKNKPQLDNEPSKDVDMQAQDLEPISESLPSHDDMPVNSSTLTGRKRLRADVIAAVSNEACHPQTVENGHSLLPVAGNSNDCTVELPGSVYCSTAEVTNPDTHSRLITGVCNVVSATLNPSDIVRHDDPQNCHLSSAPVSNKPLPKNTHRGAAKGKAVDCSRLAPLKDLPRHKTAKRQSVRQQLSPEATCREVKNGSGAWSTFDDTVGKTISRLCDSERKTVQSNECSAMVDLSNAAVSAPNTDLQAAESTAASCEQNVSLSVDKQATGNCVTLGSMLESTMHQTVTPDVILEPNVVKQQQSRVRFEGNHHWFQLFITTVGF